jgi:hypothetical protein
VLDAHANEAFCDCDSMFGHELLEGHEEASLDGNAARNRGVTVGYEYRASVQVYIHTVLYRILSEGSQACRE